MPKSTIWQLVSLVLALAAGLTHAQSAGVDLSADEAIAV